MCVWGEAGYKTRDSIFPRPPRLASPARPCVPRTQITLQGVAVTVVGRRWRRRCQVQRVPRLQEFLLEHRRRRRRRQRLPIPILRAVRVLNLPCLARGIPPARTIPLLPAGRAEWPAARERRQRYPPELQLRPRRGPGVHPAEVRGSGSTDRGLPFALVCQAGGGHGGIVSRHNLGQHPPGAEAGIHTHTHTHSSSSSPRRRYRIKAGRNRWGRYGD